MPPAAPFLLRALERLAREEGWTLTQLAEELHTQLSELSHIRAHRRHFSLILLSDVAVRFGSRPGMHENLVDYLAIDLPRWFGATLPHTAPPPTTGDSRVAPSVRARLDRYMTAFPRENLFGRGLYLVSPSMPALSGALSHLVAAFGHQGLSALRLSASGVPTSSDTKAALAASLLLIDRLDTITPAMLDLLQARIDLIRPVVVSSRVELVALPGAVRRLLRAARTTLLTVTPASLPPT